jgi:photosystem II stability/assembly factor-like uncharacterized protein
MKKRIAAFLFMIFSTTIPAQDLMEEIRVNPGDNFFQICEKADVFFAERNAQPTVANETTVPFSDNEYEAYQRWKWYWQTRVNAAGEFPDVAAMKAERDAMQQSSRSMVSGNWTSISQTTTTGGYNGMGRTTCIAFDPVNANTFYVGAPIGGLWKTTDGGQTWVALTDNLPYVSVGSCLVDPTNPSVIYISIGDHIGWWNRSLGVYKSTDGGSTWAPTGLSWQLTQGNAFSTMVMDPFNSQIIYAATSAGLYKTTNGGTNWAIVRAGYYSDVEIEPGSSNVYAALHDYWGSSEVFRSTDAGSTWTGLTSFAANYNWIRIAVTPANPAKLAVQCSAGNSPLYVSNNYGANLNYVSDCPEDAILFISPTDQNTIYCGYVYVYKSTNGGANWNMITYWYYNPPYDEVHADQHNVFYHPLNSDEIYFCNDGGLYKYNENSLAWNDLSNGLVITQFYKIAVSQNDPMMMMGGTQDNGGRLRMSSGLWRATNGGDAMEIAIDPTDDDVIYTTYVFGKLYRSQDRWVNDTYYSISDNISGGTPAGSWVAPYMIDPSNSNTIVAGYDDVWRSTDRGQNWTAISSNLAGGSTFECLAVAPTDPNTIYVSESNKLYRTFNMGGAWSMITAPGTEGITSITVHPNNPQEIWITRSGYSATQKVYHSVDGGTSWTNLSTGLPNAPVNTCVFENGSNNLIYIGTDAGVFWRDTLTNSWQLFSTGLPFTSVTDLEIYYPTRKIRAGTFGRGIWESDLSSPLSASVLPNTMVAFTLYPNPSNASVQINYTSSSVEPIVISVVNMLGEIVYSQTLSGQNDLNLKLEVDNWALGSYLVQIVQGDKINKQKLVVN